MGLHGPHLREIAKEFGIIAGAARDDGLAVADQLGDETRRRFARRPAPQHVGAGFRIRCRERFGAFAVRCGASGELRFAFSRRIRKRLQDARQLGEPFLQSARRILFRRQPCRDAAKPACGAQAPERHHLQLTRAGAKRATGFPTGG